MLGRSIYTNEFQTFLEEAGFSAKVLTLTFLHTSTDFGILCVSVEQT